MATTIDRYKLIVDTKGATSNITGLLGSLKGLGPATAAAFAIGAVIAAGKAMIDTAKQYEKFANQLKLVTANADEAASTFNAIQEASNRSGAALSDSIELFTKLKLATENLGKSTDSVVGVAEKFQKALLLSGADANTASAAIRQFGQAMASGTVRGDEFTSIVEALGPALAIMARESGLTVGELRKLSQEGKLTAERFYEMVEASKALDEQFANLNLTTEQVQTNLGKTFDEVINKIDQAAGVSKTWREFLAQTNRSLADLFNTSQSLENLSLDDLRARIESNGLRIDEALVELRGRLSELNIVQIFNGEATQIANLIKELENLKIAREELATATKAQAEADIAEDRRIQNLLAPYTALSDTLSKVKSSYEGSLPAVERLKLEQNRVNDTLQTLLRLRTEEIAANSTIDASIKLLQDRYKQLGDAITDANENAKNSLNSFDNYWNNLIKTATDSVTEMDYANQAVAKLTDAFAAGKISLEVYEAAMKRLDSTLGTVKDKSEELATFITDNALSAQERLNSSLADIDLSGLKGVARTVKEIEIEELRLMRIAQARAEAQFKDVDAQKLKEALAEIERTSRATIASRQEAARQLDAQVQAETAAARTFAAGWKKAFDDYEDNATNAAKRAEQVFAKTTKGMEDMIVNFAKTGKFEFKSFVSSLLEDLLRAQIQKSIAMAFQLPALGGGSGTVGGQAGGLFGGFFATGGMIPPGRFGVVGENGPELVSGPANVTPNLGGGNVTYNIQAVDARSFKELVAADPGFIHAVATKGGSSVPRRR